MIYLELFYEFFKIGLFTFGGGYAMIPLVKETVMNQGWITETQFYDFIGVCESTPGPIAINMATYIGSTQAGILGSIVATFGMVLPSFIIIVLIATIFKTIIKNKYFIRIMSGIKPVIIGLIISTGLILLAKCIGYQNLNTFVFDLKSLIVFVIIVILYFSVKLAFKKKINPVFLILISAGLGLTISMIL